MSVGLWRAGVCTFLLTLPALNNPSFFIPSCCKKVWVPDVIFLFNEVGPAPILVTRNVTLNAFHPFLGESGMRLRNSDGICQSPDLPPLIFLCVHVQGIEKPWSHHLQIMWTYKWARSKCTRDWQTAPSTCNEKVFSPLVKTKKIAPSLRH